MSPLSPTPGQTVGPFFGFALPYAGGDRLVPPGHPDALRLHGRVLDGAGDPVPDALIEIWQAGPDGHVVQEPGSLRRDDWTFTGWGRAETDRTGRYSFTTRAPGATAPYVEVTVFARGLLESVGPDRRNTLVTTRDDQGLVFDIRPDETVFLDHTPD